MRAPAEEIARRALEATGHRSVSPDLVRWVAQLIVLVRRIDKEQS
jgi:hypothetical protein